MHRVSRLLRFDSLYNVHIHTKEQMEFRVCIPDPEVLMYTYLNRTKMKENVTFNLRTTKS